MFFRSSHLQESKKFIGNKKLHLEVQMIKTSSYFQIIIPSLGRSKQIASLRFDQNVSSYFQIIPSLKSNQFVGNKLHLEVCSKVFIIFYHPIFEC